MNKYIYQVILIIILIYLPMLASASEHIKFEENSKIIIKERGNDGKDKFCSKFNLNVKQVKLFLKKAIIVTQHKMNYKYDYLSCYVRGVLIDSNGEHTWEIRAGGTGRISYKDGSELLLSCKKCADGFK